MWPESPEGTSSCFATKHRPVCHSLPGSGTWDGSGDTQSCQEGPRSQPQAWANAWGSPELGQRIQCCPFMSSHSCASTCPAERPRNTSVLMDRTTPRAPLWLCPSGGVQAACGMAPGSAARPSPTPQHPEDPRLPVGWHQDLLPDPLPPRSAHRVPLSPCSSLGCSFCFLFC